MKEVIKKNGKMNFRESTHTYWSDDDPSAKFTSVTTLIHSFTQPFDSDFWSAYKALEKLLDKDTWAVEKKSLMNSKKFDKTLLEIHNISEDDFNREQQAILDEWERKNKEACERGTAIHLEMENMMYDTKHNIDLSKFEIGGKFECIKDKTDLDLENGVYPEYLIHRISEDGKLRIAGQIDLLIKRGNHIVIGDYKTNASIDMKSYYDSKTKSSQKMQFPLNNLDDCNYFHYAMQLSTYAWMIQKLNPDYIIDDLVLVHFPHEGGQVIYHLPYLREEVIRMLAFYKKKIVLDEGKKKRQRIEY